MHNWKETILREQPRLSLSDKFKFACHKELSCFGKCCADVNIFITPYDVIRMKKALSISSGEFLEKYTQPLILEDWQLPVVVLKMEEDEEKKCPFVSSEGCTIYEDRPWSCRMYPLGLASSKTETGGGEEFCFIVGQDSLCEGFKEDREWTVEEWLKDQGVDTYNTKSDSYMRFTLHPHFQEKKDVGPSKVQMLYKTLYNIDGFRFDGVTSMLYYDHGLSRDFTSYDMYFDGNQDEDAITYFVLANKLIHQVNPGAITIAEEMSGMPGLAEKVENGGFGFDYRLAMGIPDYWIKIIKEVPDENWDVSQLFYELTSRRSDEKTISYAESHDQALVGDKTIIFRLADKEMYWFMNKDSQNILIDRGIALHKMIRLLTIATSGGGYLNFMGNEFGHPEWIDFPREGNNWSYKYAKRQWNLLENPSLRYHYLADFDRDMIQLFTEANILENSYCTISTTQSATCPVGSSQWNSVDALVNNLFLRNLLCWSFLWRLSVFYLIVNRFFFVCLFNLF